MLRPPRIITLQGIFLGLALLLAEVEVKAAANSSSFLIRAWQNEDGLPSNGVRAVVQAADGWLWVSTSEGLARFDGLQFFGFKEEPDATLSHLPARALFAMPDGDVWIATTRRGLLRWHKGRLREVWKDDDPSKPKPALPSVDQIVSTGRGKAIIRCGKEFWEVDGDSAPVPAKGKAFPKTKSASPSDEPEAYAELVDRRGRSWRIDGTGLTVRESSGAVSYIMLPGVDPSTQIGHPLEDRDGNIWVPTGGSGLMQIHPRLIKVISVNEGLSKRSTRAVIQDHTGALWVSVRSGGVDRIMDADATHYNVDPQHVGREVVALCEDDSGVVWAATNLGQVVLIDSNGVRPAPFGPTPGTTKVTAIVRDPQGRLWFADGLGVAVWDGQKVERLAVEPQIFSTLTVDSNGNVWAGTKSGTVYKSHGLLLERIGSVAASRGISNILADQDGSAWVSTIGGGLFHLDKGTAFGFTDEHGLPDPRLTCVLGDDSGNLWLGSVKGIFSVSKAELSKIQNGRAVTATWREFDRDDGLLARECIGGTQPAGCRGKNRHLYFATAHGVADVFPEELAPNPVPPTPSIVQLFVNGRAVNRSEQVIKAGPGRVRVEISFAGITFTAPEKAQFRARLEGLENDWQDLGHSRSAVYDSLPPGNYRFNLMAANRDGVWSKQMDSVALEVIPHFWERTSFQLMLGIFAVFMATGTGWGIARWRMRQRLLRIQAQNAREKERARIAQDLHDDLGASLTEISLLANIAAENETQHTSANNEFSRIATKAQVLVGTLDEIVWAVNPRHDTLGSLAEYLAAFAGDLFSAAGIPLRVEMPREFPQTALDAEKRHSLFLATREALNNAAKYSAATEVHLSIKIIGGVLEIVVQDNGRGFDDTCKSGGNGLENLQSRLAKMGGTSEIQSSPGKGTKVKFMLPLSAS